MLRSIALVVAVSVGVAACESSKQEAPKPVDPKRERHDRPPDLFKDERERMVDDTIERRGIKDERVLEAMRSVRRHELVPPDIRDQAYADRALPIGFGLTISQPYIVAMMTEAAKIGPGDRVLEIGTGSGYQAAVLAELGNKVYTIELHEELAKRTRLALDVAGYKEVQLRMGDGYRGWREAAPFDAILVTCAVPVVPPPLLEQLVVGGRLVAPVGDEDQVLQVLTKTASGVTTETLLEVRFGPMRGEIRRD